MELGADVDVCSSLHVAIQNNDHEAVEMFIKAGADVDQQDGYGNPPFIYAATEGIGYLDILIKAGADVNKENNAGRTALVEGILYQNVGFIDML